ncbi:MAG: type IV pilin protein [Rhizobacter sp.]|nr:type IV pilin protein [Rhizobacter sp.]
MHASPQAGFTLIELMIAMAIAGILAAIAYPSFMGPIHKARRSDGITSLLQLQMNQEQWRASHAAYAGMSELGVPATSGLRYYALDVADASTTGYALAATAIGAQAADEGCRVLRVIVAHGLTAYASGPDERTANASADNKRCWGL